MKDPMKDLERLLSRQKFKNQEEIHKFINQFMADQSQSIDDKELTGQEKAQDLVEQAFNTSGKQGVKLVNEALKLDPDCIDAYEYLAQTESSPDKRIKHLKKGIEIGRRIFGGKYLEERKGMFWGFHETRPFMRCLFNYALELYKVYRKTEAMNAFKEIIELNEGDNLGARDYLMLYQLEAGDLEGYKFYHKKFKDCGGAHFEFNHALYLFISKGDTPNARKSLYKASENNKHVIPLLISPKTKFFDDDHFIIGEKSEAESYVSIAHEIWNNTPGAIEWLKKQVK